MFNLLKDTLLLVHLGTIIGLGLIVSLVLWYLKKKVTPRLQHSRHHTAYAFIAALPYPANFFVWLMVITFVASSISSALNFHAGAAITFLQKVITVVIVLWFFMRFIRKVEESLFRRITRGDIKTDKTTVIAVVQLCRITLVTITTLVAMQSFGISISALLAFGGVGGLAVGFAAKDMIANFLGGLMIFLDRPFSVGDWIQSPDRNIEGTVTHIGWRLTHIRTFDKRPLYVPNGVLSAISIVNPSRMTNRRIKTTIAVRYQDANVVGEIIKEVKAMLQAHDEIDTSQMCMVVLTELGESSVNFLVYTFTKTTEWVRYQEVKQDVLLKILDIIAAHGAECAFPTRTLDLPMGLQAALANETAK